MACLTAELTCSRDLRQLRSRKRKRESMIVIKGLLAFEEVGNVPQVSNEMVWAIRLV